MVTISPELLDKIGELEVQALLEGLNDPQLRKNPAFLEKVRKFLVQNNLKTLEETAGVKQMQQLTAKIPEFDNEVITH